MNEIEVIKIGGSSLATIDKILELADILSSKINKLILVVSAMGDTTNKLISLAQDISDDPSKREMDMLMATGEQVSASLMSMALQNNNKKAIALCGFQVGIITEGVHQKNTIKSIDSRLIYDYLEKYDCLVVTGFQGINNMNSITTLGRGGSDTSAVALAAALNCSCKIYTDVDGIYSVDPRKANRSSKLTNLSYEEMLELAISGSKVLEPRSVELAFKYNVPLYVGKLTSNKIGTWIGR